MRNDCYLDAERDVLKPTLAYQLPVARHGASDHGLAVYSYKYAGSSMPVWKSTTGIAKGWQVFDVVSTQVDSKSI